MSGALYRPKHMAVVGPTAIREVLSSLASSGTFCEAVERVMSDPESADVEYEVAGDALRLTMEDRMSSSEAAERLASAELEVARLRARVSRLEQAFSGLRRGGSSMGHEAMQHHGGTGARRDLSPSAPPRSRPAPDAAASPAASPAAPGAAATPEPVASKPPSGPPPSEVETDEAPKQEAAPATPDAAPTEEPEAAAESSAEPAAQIPSSADLSRILEGLLGAPVPLTEAEPLAIDASCYGCMLLDDDDRIVGAFVADLRATVMLGGTLMMIPEGVLAESLEAGEPTEDMLEAMSEVLNVSSRAFNDVPGNPHVRTKVIAPIDLDAYPWLPNPVARTDHAEPNGGVITMVVCEKPA